MTERRAHFRVKLAPPPQPVAFTVAGNPRPKERARVVVRSHGKAHAYTPQRTRTWQAEVAWAAKMAMDGRPPLQGTLAVEVWFYRATRHRADADNLEKSTYDAMNGIVYEDDDQLVDGHWHKRLDRDNPRLEVRVWEIDIAED